MSEPETWYVVRQPSGQCAITPASSLEPTQPVDDPSAEAVPTPERWGPYASQQEAIARRVGLIRAGKCQPA